MSSAFTRAELALAESRDDARSALRSASRIEEQKRKEQAKAARKVAKHLAKKDRKRKRDRKRSGRRRREKKRRRRYEEDDSSSEESSSMDSDASIAAARKARQERASAAVDRARVRDLKAQLEGEGCTVVDVVSSAPASDEKLRPNDQSPGQELEAVDSCRIVPKEHAASGVSASAPRAFGRGRGAVTPAWMAKGQASSASQPGPTSVGARPQPALSTQARPPAGRMGRGRGATTPAWMSVRPSIGVTTPPARPVAPFVAPPPRATVLPSSALGRGRGRTTPAWMSARTQPASGVHVETQQTSSTAVPDQTVAAAVDALFSSFNNPSLAPAPAENSSVSHGAPQPSAQQMEAIPSTATASTTAVAPTSAQAVPRTAADDDAIAKAQAAAAAIRRRLGLEK